MKVNLSLSYTTILMSIVFILFLGQPENVVLIHASLAILGSIVANHFHHMATDQTNYVMYDVYLHWVPLFLSLALVDPKLIGSRQFLFAALYPILYLGITSYRDNNGWTGFKITNPVDHIKEMYPGLDPKVYLLYYVVLIGAYFFRDYLGLPRA